MRQKTLSIATVCTLILLISGCGVRYPNYYRLSIAPPLKEDVSSTPRPVTVAVRQFETPAYLRQGRIVYSQTPGEIGFYEYRRWAVDPGVAVTTAMVESLRSRHLFSAVAPYDGQERSDYLVSGRLEKLDEIDYGGAVRVEAKLSAELTNLHTGSVVWTGDATETSRVEKPNMNSVVAEMSHAIQGSMDQLLKGMAQQVSRTGFPCVSDYPDACFDLRMRGVPACW